MKYKLLVLDIDGTLTNTKKEITDRTKSALIKAQELGVKLVLASGRPTYGIRPLAEELRLSEFGGYILSFNGGCIVECATDLITHEKRLNKNILPHFQQIAKKKNFALVSFDESSIITETPDNEYVQKEAFLNKMPVRQVDDFLEAMNFSPSKCLMMGEPTRLALLEKEMHNTYGGQIGVYRSEPYFLELVPLNTDKAKSLDMLVNDLKITKNEVIAVGDGFNDLSMIEYAGLGVAMANAQEPVKACADYVTLSNDEDGVAHLIEKYIFSAFIGLSTSLDKINDNLKDTLMHSLGMKFTVAEEDHVEAIMPVDIRTRQPFGILHGGATLALAETVAGFGSNLLCNEGEFVVGMQVSGNHISSAREGDTVTAIAKVIHKGRSTHIWNVDVVSSMGKLISSIRVMNSILKKR